jgi:hypothetical protein
MVDKFLMELILQKLERKLRDLPFLLVFVFEFVNHDGDWVESILGVDSGSLFGH